MTHSWKTWAGFGLTLVPTLALAGPKALVLSGGGHPAANHHSQYLQTRALTESLRARFGDESIEVFFGAGNTAGTAPELADVHSRKVVDGVELDFMIPGEISRNSEASKENVSAYLNVLKKAETPFADTYFLFVSDHGMPNENILGQTDTTYSDNCIHTWSFDAAKEEFRPFADGCLSVSELGKLLPGPAQAKKVVYGMSQCFSGGFHGMSVKSDEKGRVTADTRVCGFTAAPDDLTASGCSPMADGPGYAGYERYFTKQLIGRDFVTQDTVAGGPKKTVREAHIAATLEDLTIDIPLSTIDYYLGKWAKLIMRKESDLTARYQTGADAEAEELLAQLAYGSNPAQKHVPNNATPEMERELSERREFVRKMSAALAEQWAPAGKMASQMGLSDLLVAEELHKHRMNEADKLWTKLYKQQSTLKKSQLFGLWMEALEKGETAGFTAEELKWEMETVGKYERKNGHFPRNSSITFELSFMFAKVPDGAIALSRYLNTRSKQFETWLSSQTDPVIRANAEKFEKLAREIKDAEQGYENVERAYRYTRRIRMMREQLGALYALASIGAKDEMAQIEGLRSCEASPF